MVTRTKVGTNESVDDIKRAKIWQLALFALNNSATNAYHIFMTYIAYFAAGVGGIAFITASYVMTYMRVFDAFTDPVIGFLMDKLNMGKWGKFRPWMLFGNVVMTITLVTLINGMIVIPESMRFIFFIVCYFFYIIGFTCQTACTKSAQSCLTKDPKQRPLISMFDTFFSLFVIGGYGVYVSMYLIPKHVDYNLALFQEFITTAVFFATLFTVLAIIGLWGEDIVPPVKNLKQEKTKISDYIKIIKRNDAIRKLMSAAALDKLAALTSTNPTTGIILFALIIGDYGLSGKMTFAAVIPMLMIIPLGTRLSQKYDMRRTIIGAKFCSLVLYSLIMCLALFTDFRNSTGVLLYAFLGMYIFEQGFRGFVTATFTPMIADCIDYDQAITGKSSPGMISTMYSLVEKFVSSLSATVAGACVALVGFASEPPTVTTELTTELYYMGLFLAFGLQIISSVFTIFQMLRYPLTKEKMQEIQLQLKEDNGQVLEKVEFLKTETIKTEVFENNDETKEDEGSEVVKKNNEVE